MASVSVDRVATHYQASAPHLVLLGPCCSQDATNAALVGCLVSVAIHTSHGLANRAMYSTVKIPLRLFWLVDCVVIVTIHPSHGLADRATQLSRCI